MSHTVQEQLNQHLVGCCISPVMQMRSFFAGQYGSKSYLLIFSTVLSSLATFFSKSLAMFPGNCWSWLSAALMSLDARLCRSCVAREGLCELGGPLPSCWPV